MVLFLFSQLFFFNPFQAILSSSFFLPSLLSMTSISFICNINYWVVERGLFLINICTCLTLFKLVQERNKQITMSRKDI